ncbi:MAG: hypothetical protein AAF922_15500 [Pseudomonadota bacterium]
MKTTGIMSCPTVMAAGAFALLAGTAQAQQLTDAEFEATHVGKCVAYTGASDGTQCYNADGTASYDDTSYGTDKGTWTFSKGQFCVKWSKEAGTACSTYSHDGNGGFTSGDYTWQVKG